MYRIQLYWKKNYIRYPNYVMGQFSSPTREYLVSNYQKFNEPLCSVSKIKDNSLSRTNTKALASASINIFVVLAPNSSHLDLSNCILRLACIGLTRYKQTKHQTFQNPIWRLLVQDDVSTFRKCGSSNRVRRLEISF